MNEEEEWRNSRPYVIVGMTNVEEYGEYIHEEDVVRPSNHRWAKQGSDETRKWRLKSEPRTTTYGSCPHCVRSGPVGRFCSQCNIPEAGYVIMINGPPGSTQILDSISLAQLFDLGQHESASARKVSRPIMQKLHHFNTSCARVAAGRMYQHIQDPVEKENMIRLKMVEFRNFLED